MNTQQEVEWATISLPKVSEQQVQIPQQTEAVEFTSGEMILPENKVYLLLLEFEDDTNNYIWITGRQECYEYLKGIIMIEDNGFGIDIDESMILAETSRVVERISIYQFMKHLCDEELVIEEDGFHIDDYHTDYGNMEDEVNEYGGTE